MERVTFFLFFSSFRHKNQTLNFSKSLFFNTKEKKRIKNSAISPNCNRYEINFLSDTQRSSALVFIPSVVNTPGRDRYFQKFSRIFNGRETYRSCLGKFVNFTIIQFTSENTGRQQPAHQYTRLY